jgi:D-alanyl-D-alanine carboxypeptidase/D-alanyl-D-alanine-endopeptidase (penicillin-binding protein 4)
MLNYLLTILLLIQVVVSPVYAYAPTAGLLSSHIDNLVTELDSEIQLGLAIHNITKDEALYQHHHQQAFVPASNMKLWTTIAALELLGSEYRFKTELLTDGRLTPDGTLQGNLLIKGYGDPTITEADLRRMAVSLKKKGIHKIHGNLLVDESYFDRIRLGPGWMWDDEVWGYSAQVSALALDRNSVTIGIDPHSDHASASPKLSVAPMNQTLAIQNNMQVIHGIDTEELQWERLRGTNTIRLDGFIGSSAEVLEERVSVDDPALFAGEVFARQLQREGIKLGRGSTVVKKEAHEPDHGDPGQHRNLLATHYSEPLSQIIREINKKSDNFYAEVLLKTMGVVKKGEGSFAAGAEAIGEFMKQADLPAQYRQVDGSGLSRLNLITPEQMVRLLRYVHNQSYRDVLTASLPEAGVDGTLEERLMEDSLVEGNLRAKTGTMDGVHSLSGYVTAKNGDQLAFSILMNGVREPEAAYAFQERIASLMANYPDLPASHYHQIQSAQSESYQLSALFDPILDHPKLQGVMTGMIVQDSEDKTILYERNADKSMVPASNVKLLTSMAALKQLGTDYRFETDVYVSAPIRNGTVYGDVILKGYGDPTLHTEDPLKVQEGWSIEEIAALLKQKGIRRINGDIILDESQFDQKRLGRGWMWDDESFYYNPQLSALSINRGTVMVMYEPAKQTGEPVPLTLWPQTGYVQLVNTAKTVHKHAKSTFRIEKIRGTNIIHITGDLPQASRPDYQRVPVEDPALYTGTVLKEKLRGARIELSRQSEVKVGQTPASSIKLATLQSEPLAEVVKYLNHKSDNYYAEMIMKVMGAEKKGEGSALNGLKVTQESMYALDPQLASNFHIADGSGLSRYNLITPRQLNTILQAAPHQASWFPEFYASLPTAGVTGTVKYRLVNTFAAGNVRAKTGSMQGVSSISGYVSTQDQRRISFSIVMNGYMADDMDLQRAQDVLIAAMASYREKKR